MTIHYTAEEISEILNDYFSGITHKQYIGARYVPIFGRKGEDSIIWDNSKPYEPLTIVLYQGNSYTSRQYVPTGIAITNEEFWALTGNYNAQIEQYRQEVASMQTIVDSIIDDLAINPDNYTGTDTEKLQAALDDCASDGGTILLFRQYELDGNLDVKANTNNLQITILGVGNHAGIDFDDYYFYSSLATESRAYSGLKFVNCELCNAEEKCIDGDTMIRCSFSNCFIHDNDSVAIATDYLQDYTFNQCKCTHNENILTAAKLFGGGFSQCTIEAGDSMVISTNNAFGFAINNCIIEGMSVAPIQLVQCLGVSIDGNYFEAVGAASNSCAIDISTMSTGSISVTNNYFYCATDDTDHSNIFMLIPNGVNKFIQIIGNRAANNSEYLFDIVGTATAGTGLRHLTYYGNSGFHSDITPNTVEALLPLHGGDQYGCTQYNDVVTTTYIPMNNQGSWGVFPFDRHFHNITLTEVALEGVGTRTLEKYSVYNQNSMVAYLQCTDDTEKGVVAGKVLRVKFKFGA